MAITPLAFLRHPPPPPFPGGYSGYDVEHSAFPTQFVRLDSGLFGPSLKSLLQSLKATVSDLGTYRHDYLHKGETGLIGADSVASEAHLRVMVSSMAPLRADAGATLASCHASAHIVR